VPGVAFLPQATLADIIGPASPADGATSAVNTRRPVLHINDPDVDLFAPLPNSGEYRHTILREINIIATHNSYHIGELAISAA
jgi:hypothetical protein